MLESRVIALRGLSGDHGGKNLGRYVAGLCDRVGLIGNERSKVSKSMLACDTIADKTTHTIITATTVISPPRKHRLATSYMA